MNIIILKIEQITNLNFYAAVLFQKLLDYICNAQCFVDKITYLWAQNQQTQQTCIKNYFNELFPVQLMWFNNILNLKLKTKQKNSKNENSNINGSVPDEDVEEPGGLPHPLVEEGRALDPGLAPVPAIREHAHTVHHHHLLCHSVVFRTRCWWDLASRDQYWLVWMALRSRLQGPRHTGPHGKISSRAASQPAWSCRHTGL